jgi:hypothetical protein
MWKDMVFTCKGVPGERPSGLPSYWEWIAAVIYTNPGPNPNGPLREGSGFAQQTRNRGG